jgi:hypothetical protein
MDDHCLELAAVIVSLREAIRRRTGCIIAAMTIPVEVPFSERHRYLDRSHDTERLLGVKLTGPQTRRRRQIYPQDLRFWTSLSYGEFVPTADMNDYSTSSSARPMPQLSN